MTPLPYSSGDHIEAHQFLVEEAHLLDTHQYEAWLALMADDVSYVMPARVNAAKLADEPGLQTIDHFAENLYSLRKRVERFATKYAWTEDPPSRVRHHVTNVRTFPTDDPAELLVESGLLLFRSRGDHHPADVLSAGRADVLRKTPDGVRLVRRHITIDESVLRTQNLAVFL